jgi:hypothetical protein
MRANTNIWGQITNTDFYLLLDIQNEHIATKYVIIVDKTHSFKELEHRQ